MIKEILMIQDAESFGFVENVTDTMKFMKFFLFSFIIHVPYLSASCPLHFQQIQKIPHPESLKSVAMTNRHKSSVLSPKQTRTSLLWH
jgi:hypothetical protein